MEKFKNEFLEVVYEEQNNICIADWTEVTEDANPKDFKDWNKALVKVTESCNSIRLLANTLNYKFLITTDLQKWSVSNIFQPFAKAGIRKIAIIVPLDLFPNIALKQFSDEYEEGNIETIFFTDLEEARTWLIS